MRPFLIAAVLITTSSIGRAQPPEGTPLACRTDADCPTPACGPCTPGAALTRERVFGMACAVNPCLNPRSVCGPQGRCMVGSGVTPNPRVFGTPSPR